jgi:hypothetical protein
MNSLFIYVGLAIASMVLVLVWLRHSKPEDADEAIERQAHTPCVANGRWLNLSERIFDPADVRWLERELAFPKLARALRLDRKRLAILWLEALQSSFDELVRTPEAISNVNGPSPANGWSTLWLILRFKLLISYALIVVKVLGPYHSMIPSFAWLPFSQGNGRAIRHEALAGSRTSN